MEKLREIGSMRAIGAKRKDILIIFIFQGMIIGAIGAWCWNCSRLRLYSLCRCHKNVIQ